MQARVLGLLFLQESTIKFLDDQGYTILLQRRRQNILSRWDLELSSRIFDFTIWIYSFVFARC